MGNQLTYNLICFYDTLLHVSLGKAVFNKPMLGKFGGDHCPPGPIAYAFRMYAEREECGSVPRALSLPPACGLRHEQPSRSFFRGSTPTAVLVVHGTAKPLRVERVELARGFRPVPFRDKTLG